MPPAPQSGQSALLQSGICAGLKSMVFWVTATFEVHHRQPSHQSRTGDPVRRPAYVVVSIDADGRLDLQAAIVKGPETPPSTSVQALSKPAEQKRSEFCQSNTLPPLLTKVLLSITDWLVYEP